jgi:hypothetical protein
MFCPSIVVVNCGISLIRFSTARHSNSSRQRRTRSRTGSTRTP